MVAIAPDLKTAAFSLRECCKQLVLLEDHLAHPEKRCDDCIHKHTLAAEAFADEAATLDGCDRFRGVNRLGAAIRGVRHDPRRLRDIRKQLSAELRSAGLGSCDSCEVPMKAQATVRRHVEPVLVARSAPARGRTVPAGVGFIGDLLLAVLPPAIQAGGAVGTAYVGGLMTQQQLKTKLEGERELIHATGASQLALARQQQSAAGDQLDFLKALAVPALIGFGLYLVFK